MHFPPAGFSSSTCFEACYLPVITLNSQLRLTRPAGFSAVTARRVMRPVFSRPSKRAQKCISTPICLPCSIGTATSDRRHADSHPQVVEQPLLKLAIPCDSITKLNARKSVSQHRHRFDCRDISELVSIDNDNADAHSLQAVVSVRIVNACVFEFVSYPVVFVIYFCCRNIRVANRIGDSRCHVGQIRVENNLVVELDPARKR